MPPTSARALDGETRPRVVVAGMGDVGVLVATRLARVRERLGEVGVRVPPVLIKSNGGEMSGIGQKILRPGTSNPSLTGQSPGGIGWNVKSITEKLRR